MCTIRRLQIFPAILSGAAITNLHKPMPQPVFNIQQQIENGKIRKTETVIFPAQQTRHLR